MNPLWGILMSVIGLFLLICSLSKTDYIVYKLLIHRSKMLWGKNVYLFHAVVGAIIILLGVLASLGVIW